MTTTKQPSVSIVICTDGRAKALDLTLSSLRYLDYKNFEVVVVCGPTEDGTDKILEKYKGKIKTAKNPERNLSISRNIGIRLSSAEIVAFLDDDAIPEPEWLNDVVQPYKDQTVGAAGGFVYGPDGFSFQYKYGTVNRLGDADLTWTRPSPELCYPFSQNFPHLLGANSTFRRKALIQVGGFDEEYEYYLDETDVQLRVLDAGWQITQIEGAYVHHKFMPSHIRTDAKILKNWFPILKNKIYFCMRHASQTHTSQQVIRSCHDFIEHQRVGMEWTISEGLLDERYREIFDEHANKAWKRGILAALNQQPRIRNDLQTNLEEKDFLLYPEPMSGVIKRTYCFLSQSYPPGDVGGIGRYVHQLAREVAQMGHNVHVITKSDNDDMLDFEDGVWVHRVSIGSSRDISKDLSSLPGHIGLYCHRVRTEVEKINSRRKVTAVYAPTWDCEGYAFLDHPDYPLVLSLQTTLKSYLKSNAHLALDQKFMAEFGNPMIAAELALFQRADGIHALSHANADDISLDYNVQLSKRNIEVIQLGAADWADIPIASLKENDNKIRLLFVGRLEKRKAIDVTILACRDIFNKYSNVQLDIVGDDQIPWDNSLTYKQILASDPMYDELKDKIIFHGKVSDEKLRSFYANCDILVTPSRYESFGLMLVEGMMFSKVVIGARIGGMQEVVEHGVSGFLVEPDNVTELSSTLLNLVQNPDLRKSIGTAARNRYEKLFTPIKMAEGVVKFIDSVAHKWSEDRSFAKAERSTQK